LVPSADEDNEPGGLIAASAQFRANESMIRTGGDVLDIASAAV